MATIHPAENITPIPSPTSSAISIPALIVFLALCTVPLLYDGYVAMIAAGTGAEGFLAYVVGWGASYAMVVIVLVLAGLPVLIALSAIERMMLGTRSP